MNLHHHKIKMVGRDPHESHRVATPLELLFDLTFVISFGFAASQLAHALAEGHFLAGLMAFGMASYAICLAWSNFSWFASAYDTDDWMFRVTTMVQMLGVLILSTGLPGMFLRVEKTLDMNSTVIVGGYVVMRIALVFQWLRAAQEDPTHRKTCLTYAAGILLAQVGWILRVFFDLPLVVSTLSFFVLVVLEFAGPYLAQRKFGEIPWHAHHIVERYSLFAIIALGEGIVGTVATLSAIIEQQGWTLDTAIVGFSGIGITFALWWIYFLIPSAHILHDKRERSLVWGFAQVILIISIVAIGAGLHVAAYFLEGKAHVSSLTTVAIVAVPVGVFLLTVYLLNYYLTSNCDRFHIWLLSATAIVFSAAFVAANMGASMASCLLILTLAPTVTVVGYEWKGYRRQSEMLAGSH